MMKQSWAALAGCSAIALLATGALADGMPSRGGSIKDAPVAAAPFSWSGFYVGGNVGGAWADLSHTTTTATNDSATLNFDPSSFAGGVQGGYQIQMGAMVFGLEMGLTGFELSQRRDFDPAFVVGRTRRVDVDWLFTLTPRIGFASDKWMVYLKGGYANADVSTSVYNTANDFQRTGTNRRQDGWTIGTGFEYAVNSVVSMGVDYSFVQIDPKRRPAFTQFDPLSTTNSGRFSDIDLHLVTARINFKLGGGR